MKCENNLKRIRFLEGKQIFITPRSMEDFENHYKWDHDKQLIYLDDKYFRPRSYEKAREEFEQRINSNDTMTFSIIHSQNGEHIGLIELYGIDNYERKCYWGIILAKEYWGHGYGTESALILLKYVFEDLGFRRLKSYTHSGNKVSMLFHEKLGFIKEGVLRKEYFFDGEYVDGIDYGMLKEDYERVKREA